jgi:hypothetical protein
VTEEEKTKRIAELNDALRTTGKGGAVLMTAGVQRSENVEEIMSAVRDYKFNGVDENNPYSENDFGVIRVGGIKYYFKIDYYDNVYRYLSPDPSDPKVTSRVLTIMRADEY